MIAPGDKTALLSQIRYLFWDKNLEEADIEQYPLWVIQRVLDFGDLPDVQSLMQFYGRESFLSLVAQVRFTTPRAENFWRQILEREHVPCMRKSYPQEANLFWRR